MARSHMLTYTTDFERRLIVCRASHRIDFVDAGRVLQEIICLSADTGIDAVLLELRDRAAFESIRHLEPFTRVLDAWREKLPNARWAVVVSDPAIYAFARLALTALPWTLMCTRTEHAALRWLTAEPVIALVA